MTLVPAFMRQRQTVLCEFKSRMVYIACSRTDRGIPWECQREEGGIGPHSASSIYVQAISHRTITTSHVYIGPQPPCHFLFICLFVCLLVYLLTGRSGLGWVDNHNKSTIACLICLRLEVYTIWLVLASMLASHHLVISQHRAYGTPTIFLNFADNASHTMY